MNIPFNKPYMTGKELDYIKEAHANDHLSGNGPFTKRCEAWLEEHIGCKKAFLTHSGTAALEMAAILADIRPGDEIIMPSYTFVSTANAFVLRGGVPVFIDIRPDTLNVNEAKIEKAITPRTKAIVPVHYGGVGCEMDAIMDIARRHRLLVIEDAAHTFLSTYKGRSLGSIGHMASFSFHETKNIISGEGGALLINDFRFYDRAEIIRDKGTNRKSFFSGKVDKYTWVDIGSSYSPNELTAAFLLAQMEEAENIIKRRFFIWKAYHNSFQRMEKAALLRRPVIPEGCAHNAHMYYLLLPNLDKRRFLISNLKKDGIGAVFHYIPLDRSFAGKKYSRTHGTLTTTLDVSDRIVRLPFWTGMTGVDVEYVIKGVLASV